MLKEKKRKLDHIRPGEPVALAPPGYYSKKIVYGAHYDTLYMIKKNHWKTKRQDLQAQIRDAVRN